MVVIGLGLSAQRFTLDKRNFIDTLYINDYIDVGVDLQNKSGQKAVIKWRTLVNTLDTAAWTVLFCSYPDCRSYIADVEITDSIDDNQTVRIANMNIEPGETPKDCELLIEMFDMADSSFRDTISIKFGSKMELRDSTGLSVKENMDVSSIKVYPNPTSGVVHINSEKTLRNLRVLDVAGKLVYTINGELDQFTEIDLSDLNKGSYILQLEENGVVVTEKLLLE